MTAIEATQEYTAEYLKKTLDMAKDKKMELDPHFAYRLVEAFLAEKQRAALSVDEEVIRLAIIDAISHLIGNEKFVEGHLQSVTAIMNAIRPYLRTPNPTKDGAAAGGVDGNTVGLTLLSSEAMDAAQVAYQQYIGADAQVDLALMAIIIKTYARVEQKEALSLQPTATRQPVAADGRIRAYEEALTPSAKTKVAYNGEFKFQKALYDADGDNERAEWFTVPWTTIKEIMAAIKAIAVLGEGNG